MDLPREQKPVLDREQFLLFLIKINNEMQLPKKHPLSELAYRMHLMIHGGMNKGDVNTQYKKYTHINPDGYRLDYFSLQIKEIAELGKKNKNPNLDYFYEFVNDTYHYSEGNQPLFQDFLRNKFQFLCELKNEVQKFSSKNAKGVSQGVDKLADILSVLDAVPIDSNAVKNGTLSLEDQIFIYKMFNNCKNIYEAKQKQWITSTRNRDAQKIYDFIEIALPDIRKKHVDHSEFNMDSFELIGQALSDNNPPQKIEKPAGAPPLPPRSRSSSLSSDKSPPPLQPRRRSASPLPVPEQNQSEDKVDTPKPGSTP